MKNDARKVSVNACSNARRKKGMSFKDLHAAIVGGKLFATKSAKFDNVLRRTLSTSKKVKRVARGIYAVA